MSGSLLSDSDEAPRTRMRAPGAHLPRAPHHAHAGRAAGEQVLDVAHRLRRHHRGRRDGAHRVADGPPLGGAGRAGHHHLVELEHPLGEGDLHQLAGARGDGARLVADPPRHEPHLAAGHAGEAEPPRGVGERAERGALDAHLRVGERALVGLGGDHARHRALRHRLLGDGRGRGDEQRGERGTQAERGERGGGRRAGSAAAGAGHENSWARRLGRARTAAPHGGGAAQR
jgi:hypothetical protein